MRLTVDSTDVDASLVTCNHGLNYGRFDFTSLTVHPYSASFPHREFVRRLADTYAKCVDELKHDDDVTGEESDLAAAGWPSLEELLTMSELAIDTIETFLDRDAFAAFGLIQPDAEFTINSTESVLVDSDNVIISGRCFRRVVA